MLAVEVAALDCLALVPALLALRESDDDFDVFTSREEFRRDHRQAFFFANSKYVELFAADQKFARRRVDRTRTRLASLVEFDAETRVIEPRFAVADGHVGAFELDMAVACSPCLGSGEDNSRNNFFAEFIIKTRSSIDNRRSRL